MRIPGILMSCLILITMHLCACSKAGPGAGGSGGPDSTVIQPLSDTPLNTAAAATLADVSYGADAKQKMDIHLLAGRNNSTPLLILLHGGAWSAGDKNELKAIVDFFTGQGVNVANINYRLTNNSSSSVRWPDILSDIGNAVDFIRAQSATIGTRNSRFVLFGLSAGAQLALLHSYSYDSDGLVSAVIGFGTPTKFNDIAWKSNPFANVARQALPPLTGQNFTTDTSNSLLKKLSPYYSSRFKPTLLLHGDQDKEVPFSQSVLMKAKLETSGVASSFIPLPHAGHSGEGVNAQDYTNAFNACAAWVKKYSN